MKQWDLFEIVLDKDNLQSGDILTGKVVLRIMEPMELKGIMITISGEARTEFIVVDDTRRNQNEYYFTFEEQLWSQGEKDSLEVGLHDYPFSFKLPSNIPSSFEGEYGLVRYYCKCTIEGIKKYNYEIERNFYVVRPYDLNLVDNLSGISINEHYDSPETGCLCCYKGPVSVDFRIPKIGYVPGEVILISAIVKNHRNSAVRRTEVSLRQRVIYHVSHYLKVLERIVATTSRNEIPPGGTDTWSNVPLPVPCVPPSNLDGCQLMDLSYHLDFGWAPGRDLHDTDICVPIIIGTIPLRDPPNQISINIRTPLDTLQEEPCPSPPPVPENGEQQQPDSPPPPYEQSLGANGNEKEINASNSNQVQIEITEADTSPQEVRAPLCRESSM